MRERDGDDDGEDDLKVKCVNVYENGKSGYACGREGEGEGECESENENERVSDASEEECDDDDDVKEEA